MAFVDTVNYLDYTEEVQTWRAALAEVANISGWVLNPSDPESQLIDEFIESLSNQMPEDGSTNWDLSPRYDVTPDESDDAGEMVQDSGADLPRELPPRYDDYIDDAVDVMQEAHVVPDDVADAPQEARVVEDHVANLPQVCPICVTNARNMAFRCGHMTCVECGERLDTCHICREPISCRIRLFLG